MKIERKTGKNCNCKLKCFEKLNDTAKQDILTVFNNIANKVKQDIFLGGQIVIKKIARSRPDWVEDENVLVPANII